MKLSATHAFNCIVIRVKFGLTNFEDILPALHSPGLAIELGPFIKRTTNSA